MKQLLHTPEGVRDIYGEEYAAKDLLVERLKKVFHMYGFHDIQTPLFEFFDVFRKEIGTIPSRELYKFFDREGNTLVLRPDMTPQIARVAATMLSERYFPERMCYTGNTYVNQTSYQGKLKENTQMGAEIIGLNSAFSDAEMIAMAVECLKSAGLTHFQIMIGNVEFFHSMIAELKLGEEQQARIRELIANRNYFGVEELLEDAGISAEIRENFSTLSDLTGGAEILEIAKKIAPNETSTAAIIRLEEIYELLKAYGVEEYVSFDLSMCGTYGYYTGIIFRAYTFGTGDAIVKGGRYDALVEKFGRKAPSIGFAIVVDELQSALMRQKIEIPVEKDNILVLFDIERQKDAILLAGQLRGAGQNVELVQRDPKKSREYYEAYCGKKFANQILYVKKEMEVTMLNLVTGQSKVIKGGE